MTGWKIHHKWRCKYFILYISYWTCWFFSDRHVSDLRGVSGVFFPMDLRKLTQGFAPSRILQPQLGPDHVSLWWKAARARGFTWRARPVACGKTCFFGPKLERDIDICFFVISCLPGMSLEKWSLKVELAGSKLFLLDVRKGLNVSSYNGINKICFNKFQNHVHWILLMRICAKKGGH